MLLYAVLKATRTGLIKVDSNRTECSKPRKKLDVLKFRYDGVCE